MIREFLRTCWVYPFIFLLKIAAGEWHAERYAKRHPEKGI